MAKELLQELNDTTTELLNIITAFSQEQFNMVPFEGSWTAGQVAEHLRQSYGAADVLRGAVQPATRPPDKYVEQLRSTFLNFEVKMKSPDFVVPPDRLYDRETQLKALSEKLAYIRDAVQTLDLTQLCLDFQLPGAEKFTRLEWVYFILYHTQRHIRQIKNIQKMVSAGQPAGIPFRP